MIVELPYETIGLAVVFIILTLLIAAGIILLYVAAIVSWYRGLTRCINIIWRNYSVQNPPPYRWHLLSAAFVSIRDLDPQTFFDVRAHLKEKQNDD